MGHNDRVDFELHDSLTAAIESGLLNEDDNRNAIGVAQQVIHQGYASLSPKQRVLYDRIVVPALEASAEELHINEIMNRSPD